MNDNNDKAKSNPQEKFYNHSEVESRFYQICESRKYFELDGNKHLQKDNKSFCIMMPPPNVTGALHIGHALTFTLQDIITRYKRMDGYKTLYQPGLDHAGIATQNVVEKQLLAQGIKKEDIGREAFLQKVWEWKENCGGVILNQMRYLGITPAWERLRFTMDKGLQNAVKGAFVQWYNKGYIIQDSYMINWCTHDGALSDIEVEYEQKEGKLYHLRYFLADESNESAKSSTECVIVATTRPETYFGDSAVMVNPNDERYRHLVGKKVTLPLLNRSIPIIADSHVDMEFGTGCVKVTPAHDVNDYEVGKRHNLEFITIFDEKGMLNHHAAQFAGLERLEAREQIVQWLESSGFVEKIENYTHQVGVCYRCGNVVEPYISKQWFVKKEIASNAIKRVNSKELNFIPPQWLNNYNAWNKELRDWCISRQLWWGHRIPVWYCQCGEKIASIKDNPTCKKCNSIITKQDDDVLDTWFSSGLWAFSTLGWGNGVDSSENAESSKADSSDPFNESDLKDFYPNSLLITGFDILFFWVARMILSGESLLNKLPFKDVYLHALVRDKNGQKMSKSKGNVIDPLELIRTYGADCLRFSLAYLCAQGRDVRLSTEQLDITKNFTNKLYNATSFLQMYLEQLENKSAFSDLDSIKLQTNLGIYMASRLNEAIKNMRNALDSYRFNDGASVIYRFLWSEFCDWGIELAKADKSAIKELVAIFKEALKLLHPYMPFISEYLWQKLNGTNLENDKSIMIMPYPQVKIIESGESSNLLAQFECLKDMIISIRRLKATLELGNAKIQKAYIKPKISLDKNLATQFIAKLAKVQELVILDSTQSVENCVCDVSEQGESFIELSDIDLSGILKRLDSQKSKLEKEKLKLENMLNNENFIKNAPPQVLEQNTQALSTIKEKLNKITAELSTLNPH